MCVCVRSTSPVYVGYTTQCIHSSVCVRSTSHVFECARTTSPVYVGSPHSAYTLKNECSRTTSSVCVGFQFGYQASLLHVVHCHRIVHTHTSPPTVPSISENASPAIHTTRFVGDESCLQTSTLHLIFSSVELEVDVYPVRCSDPCMTRDWA